METESEYVASFEKLEYPPSRFNHEAHVRLGWAYLKESPLPEAIIRFRDALKRLAAHIGKSSKYHETVTIMYMLLIHEKFQDGETWLEFRDRNPELIKSGRDLLLRYFCPETLESELARTRFVLPDLKRP